MELENILSKDCVVPCAHVSSKRQLLQLASERAAEKTGLPAHEIFDTLVDREKCGTTGLGKGIAVPHGRLKGLDKLTGLFFRLDEPIDFDALDDQPVDLAFVLLAPLGAGADHLKTLSRIARAMRADGFVSELRATRDTDRLYDLLSHQDPAHSAA